MPGDDSEAAEPARGRPREHVARRGEERMDNEGGAQDVSQGADHVPGDVRLEEHHKRAIEKNEPKPL